MEAALEEQEEGAEGSDEAGSDDDAAEEQVDKPIYNPLNLPLGWDGKPIPFWLYKLHGLGEEFKCEICGNYSYWGRRAFDRHFSEWRHAYGMRSLKIPNTSHFKDVECEDSQGHVMSLRAYTDLKRQGLV